MTRPTSNAATTIPTMASSSWAAASRIRQVFGRSSRWSLDAVQSSCHLHTPARTFSGDHRPSPLLPSPVPNGVHPHARRTPTPSLARAGVMCWVMR